MGVPKALVPIDGVPLWRRQVGILQALEPAELMISAGSDWKADEGPWIIVRDRISGLGPLGGIAAALSSMSTKLLLVLAIDMPCMTTRFLGDLVGSAGAMGVIPVADGLYQGLAAVYPKSSFTLMEEVLGGGDRSIQHFVKRALDGKLVAERRISDSERLFFRNVNRPDDLGSAAQASLPTSLINTRHSKRGPS
jgi:molybdopterin-guanine dinucleotide biosynthesis protein A